VELQSVLSNGSKSGVETELFVNGIAFCLACAAKTELERKPQEKSHAPKPETPFKKISLNVLPGFQGRKETSSSVPIMHRASVAVACLSLKSWVLTKCKILALKPLYVGEIPY